MGRHFFPASMEAAELGEWERDPVSRLYPPDFTTDDCDAEVREDAWAELRWLVGSMDREDLARLLDMVAAQTMATEGAEPPWIAIAKARAGAA